MYRSDPVRQEGECLVWTASRNSGGYGHRYFRGRLQLAHRVAWQVANGPIPDGLCVLHLCGSPRGNDATVRQALIDRFGGKECAIGRKASPGPLHGITGDGWSALAVAVTQHDRETT